MRAILGARERGETIFIHGDYDADGVTSATIFTHFLTRVGCNVIVHVPHRIKEGYGVHANAVDAAIRAGTKLFVTCDCGVSANEQVERAIAAGMDVVVTDHHLPPESLPRAKAVIDAHRPDSTYPFQELSGAGVVYRFCEGLARELEQPVHKYREAYADLAAIGTIADVMPLQDENRVIAHFGSQRLSETRRKGLVALLRESRLIEKPRLTARDIGFMIGPRINAAGRIDDAARALDLLLQNDELEAAKIASEIEGINTARKELQNDTEREAIEMVLEGGLEDRFVIVVGSETWHPGVIGLVAGRLVERFRRPAVVMSIDREKQIARGSCRSIHGFHLGDSLTALSHLLSGGGHALAAGFSADATNISKIADAFHEYALGVLSAEDFIPVYEVDVEVEGREVNLASVTEFSKLEPFGASNPEPTLFCRNVEILQVMTTKNPNVVRLRLRPPGGQIFYGISFRNGEEILNMGSSFLADLVFRPVLDEYNGRVSVKWNVEHLERVN